MNILLTGCNGGIGSSVKDKLILEGHTVIGLDYNVTDKNDYKVDIRDDKQVYNAYLDISKKIDHIDAIIHLAGIYNLDSLLEISSQDIKNIFDINFLGVYRINKYFYPLLKKGSKIIITTSELATYDPLPFNGLYSISKSTLDKYSFSLRQELNNQGIKVVVVRPGAIKTNLLNDSTSSLDRFINKTTIFKGSSKKFKKIIESVEVKALPPSKLAKLISKIINKNNPRYSYSINRNIGLVLLSILPKRLQVSIISKLIKE